MRFIEKYFGNDWLDYYTNYHKYAYSQYRYMLIDENGFLVWPIFDNPAGWDSLKIRWVRHKEYHSVFRNYVLSLKFVKTGRGGGLKIDEYYNNFGIQAYLGVEIWEADPFINDYNLAYTGVLDFKPGKFVIERDFVQAGIMDGDKQNKLITRDNISFNLFSELSADNEAITPFVSSPRDITYKPYDVLLEYSSDIRFKDELELRRDNVGNDNITETLYSSAYLDEEYVNELQGRVKLTESEGTQNIYVNETGSNVIIEIQDTTILLQNTELVATILSGAPVWSARIITQLYLRVINTEGATVNDYTVQEIGYDISVNTGSETFPITWDTSSAIRSVNVPNEYSLQYGIRMFNELIWLGNGKAELKQIGTSGRLMEQQFNIIENSTGAPESLVKVMLAHEAFTRLMQQTTSEQDTSKLLYSKPLGRTDSEFETYQNNGEASLTGITNGLLIRQYPGRPLNVSFRDLFRAYNAMFNLTLIYDRPNDRFVIANKREAYDNTYLIADLGEVKDFTREPMGEAYFARIKAGWKKVSYEKVQGAEEINTNAEYSEVSQIKQDYAVQSTLYGDSIGQELPRKKPYKTNSSEDTRQDDFNFIIDTDGNETIQGGEGVEGFIGVKKAYNLRLTPRKNLKRHGDVLLSSLYKSDSSIKFESRQKNSELSYIDNGQQVNENDDITQAELQNEGYTPLFIPEIYKFKVPFNNAIIQALANDPNGYFRLTFDGEAYEGHIDDVSTVDYPLDGEWALIAKEVSIGDNKIFEDDQNHILEDDNNRILET